MSAKSSFVGTQGNDLQGKINILNCSFIQSLQCHVVNGEMNGNSICSLQSILQNTGEPVVRLKVKLKDIKEQVHGGKETVLNYVKTI